MLREKLTLRLKSMVSFILFSMRWSCSSELPPWRLAALEALLLLSWRPFACQQGAAGAVGDVGEADVRVEIKHAVERVAVRALR